MLLLKSFLFAHQDASVNSQPGFVLLKAISGTKVVIQHCAVIADLQKGTEPFQRFVRSQDQFFVLDFRIAATLGALLARRGYETTSGELVFQCPIPAKTMFGAGKDKRRDRHE